MDDEGIAAYERAARQALAQLAGVLQEDPPGNHEVLLDLAILCARHPIESLAWAVATANAEDPLVRAGGILCIGVFGSDAVAYRSLVVAAQSDQHPVVRMAANGVVRLVVESRPPDPVLLAAVRDAVKGTPFDPENTHLPDHSTPG